MRKSKRNEVLQIAILQVWKSISDFCRRQGFYPNQVGGLINCKVSPFTKKGEFRKVCLRLSEALGMSPGELFPLELYGEKAREVPFSRLPGGCKSVARIPSSASPETQAECADLAKQTRRVLATLTPREEKVLRMRFGIGEKSEHTLVAVAQGFRTTREFMRRIEAKALRRLRHPSLSSLQRMLRGEEASQV